MRKNIFYKKINRSAKKSFLSVTLFLIGLTVLIAAGQIFSYPGAVRDAVTGQFPEGYRLTYPLLYEVFAPFFQLADHLTILSLKQHVAFLFFLNAIWIFSRIFIHWGTPFGGGLFLRECAKLLLFHCGFLAFVVWVVLVPKPMAKLEVLDNDLVIVNFHSHSSHSWDARKSFTPERNLLWHARAGFDANFITDHNTYSVSKGQDRLFKGEEVSLYQSHWVLLGIQEELPNVEYDIGPEGIETFLKDMRKQENTFVIASLPEYWFYHWGEDMDRFKQWGVDGFEIVNSVPHSLDFTEELRETVVNFCRRNDLTIVGATDSHGWGSTVYVWNTVRVPQWRRGPLYSLEQEIIRVMKSERFHAVRVIVRVKAEPSNRWFRLAVDPFLQAWEASRSMPGSQAVSCLLWMWGPWIGWKKIKNRLNVG